jgi:hypothetical protein
MLLGCWLQTGQGPPFRGELADRGEVGQIESTVTMPRPLLAPVTTAVLFSTMASMYAVITK